MTDLKPCACGSKDKPEFCYDTNQWRCFACDAQTPFCPNHETAQRAWNAMQDAVSPDCKAMMPLRWDGRHLHLGHKIVGAVTCIGSFWMWNACGSPTNQADDETASRAALVAYVMGQTP